MNNYYDDEPSTGQVLGYCAKFLAMMLVVVGIMFYIGIADGVPGKPIVTPTPSQTRALETPERREGQSVEERIAELEHYSELQREFYTSSSERVRIPGRDPW